MTRPRFAQDGHPPPPTGYRPRPRSSLSGVLSVLQAVVDVAWRIAVTVAFLAAAGWVWVRLTGG